MLSWTHAIESATLAPSCHNTQPWLFRTGSDFVELYADRSRSLPVADPQDRELTISCGAALFNLRLAVRAQGFADLVELLPTPSNGVLARVRAGGHRSPTPRDLKLYQAIPLRHTNRGQFTQCPVSPEDLAECIDAAQQEGASFTILTRLAKDLAANMIAEGDRLQANDVDFRRELASWAHPTGSADGVPGSMLTGLALTGSGAARAIERRFWDFAFPFVVRRFDWGATQAARDRRLAADSPVLAAISTNEDSPAAWLATGQALEHVLLEAASRGITASFLNQPVQLEALRWRFRWLLHAIGTPQIVLRLGHEADEPSRLRTARRPVDQVVVR